MLAARLPGNSNYDSSRPGGPGAASFQLPSSPAKTSDHAANIAGGSAWA